MRERKRKTKGRVGWPWSNMIRLCCGWKHKRIIKIKKKCVCAWWMAIIVAFVVIYDIVGANEWMKRGRLSKEIVACAILIHHKSIKDIIISTHIWWECKMAVLLFSVVSSYTLLWEMLACIESSFWFENAIETFLKFQLRQLCITKATFMQHFHCPKAHTSINLLLSNRSLLWHFSDILFVFSFGFFIRIFSEWKKSPKSQICKLTQTLNHSNIVTNMKINLCGAQIKMAIFFLTRIIRITKFCLFLFQSKT